MLQAIETKGLTKYYGKIRGIDNINLTVSEGEIFGFIGPNGAGKSTTIRLLLDFIRPSQGKAMIFGRDCFKESKEIKRDIGYLPSEINYYHEMTVKELLNFSAKFYNKDCQKEMNRLCDIFEVDVSKKIYSLSLGTRKKVGIIQALLHKPRLLIMDEPTGGLDPLMQNRFFEVLHEHNKQGNTIFFSSHVLPEVQRLCHRVGFIKDGKIIKLDTMENLRSKMVKKVKILYFHPVFDFTIPGAKEIKVTGNEVNFIYTGNAKSLLRELKEHEIKDIWIEEPSLDDIFMHYYGEVS